jgi:hypothetical protein
MHSPILVARRLRRFAARRAVVCLLALSMPLVVTGPAPAEAAPQQRWAVLVGVDDYSLANKPAAAVAKNRRSGISDLAGCVNDVRAMESLLLSRFGFDAAHMTTLVSPSPKSGRVPTRDAILAALEDTFLKKAQPGDIGVFYYSGHGSQIRNSKSDEADKRDETIVPADGQDIRDKELGALYNKIAERGVILTVISDSCHSGSIARGYFTNRRARLTGPNESDVADPTKIDPPERKGVLVLSASQDEEVSIEAQTPDGTQRGAFTHSFERAVGALGTGAPVELIFTKTVALLKHEGFDQKPVLGASGDMGRREKDLLGRASTMSATKPVVAVAQVDGDSAQLLGGRVVGIYEGAELKRVAEQPGDASVKLRVTKSDLGTSVADLVDPATSRGTVKGGDLFEVDVWSHPVDASLRVFVPPSTLKLADVERQVAETKTWGGLGNITWLDSATKRTPSHILRWSGSAWTLRSALGEELALGTTVDAGVLTKRLDADIAKLSVENPLFKGQQAPSVFVDLPPTASLVEAVRKANPNPKGLVTVVDVEAAADYKLVGRVAGDKVTYGWVKLNADTSADITLPLETSGVALAGDGPQVKAAVDQLQAYARNLGKIKAWLAMTAESAQASTSYPYDLVLRRTADGATVTSSTPITEGEEYGLYLQLREGAENDLVNRMYVYIYSIDREGRSQLLFPADGGVENRLPVRSSESGNQKLIKLGDDPSIRVEPPFGNDVFVLVLAETQIARPELLESEGVVTRDDAAKAKSRGEDNPLSNLLHEMGSDTPTRGTGRVKTTGKWAVRAFTVASRPRG